jgi:hypothetical protein
VASIAAASLTLPAGHRDLLRELRYLAIPFEIAAITAIAIGVRNMPPRVAAAVETERAILYYAFVSWFRKSTEPDGTLPFSYHTRNGYAGILYTIIFLSIIETTAVDFVLRVHHRFAANVLLALGAFAALWLLGFARAVQLRPILVSSEMLHLRMGLQWMLDVPRANIASIDYGRTKAPRKGTPGYLRMAPQPNAILTLREPMQACGPYGIRRDVTHVGLAIDDLQGFQRALTIA